MTAQWVSLTRPQVCSLYALRQASRAFQVLIDDDGVARVTSLDGRAWDVAPDGVIRRVGALAR